MTSKDRTGDQLVASIRRTKAAATKGNATSPATAATRARGAARPGKGAKAGKTATDVSAGRYQAGRRVWPD